MAFKRLAAHSGCSKLCFPYVLYTGGEYNDEKCRQDTVIVSLTYYQSQPVTRLLTRI